MRILSIVSLIVIPSSHPFFNYRTTLLNCILLLFLKSGSFFALCFFAIPLHKLIWDVMPFPCLLLINYRLLSVN
ncbi:hypothetical protein AQUCO_02200285v1 [Aquilegia coerulea]|uniref:Uncharacterized protein n=1 Tax=Aquilegia coerulea TaxID=218851 RepID=A0A2G5DE32_AQUCA|nr:hypothetical protein AQUCO_02200285v1 [Aquilegia coerulea]